MRAEGEGWTLIQGDCLDILPTLADNSIDLVLTDPPYHRVKGEAWDRQWKTDADYLDWLGRVLAEFQRVLKPNGSLYLFASPRMAARVEVKTGERFNVLNRVVWRKHDGSGYDTGMHSRMDEALLRSWLPRTEYIIFAEHYGADNIAKGEAGYVAKCDDLRGFVFEPLRAYLDGERQRAGIDKEDINEALGFRRLGGMAGRHYFSQSQWQLPTAEHYTKMRELFNRLTKSLQIKLHDSNITITLIHPNTTHTNFTKHHINNKHKQPYQNKHKKHNQPSTLNKYHYHSQH
jgi:site-specific DNA-methyltransferase (adenine-specific)